MRRWEWIDNGPTGVLEEEEKVLFICLSCFDTDMRYPTQGATTCWCGGSMSPTGRRGLHGIVVEIESMTRQQMNELCNTIKQIAGVKSAALF